MLGLVTPNTIHAAEILAITPIAATSHWNVMSSILEVLINRGHKVTVVTPFSRKTPHENYTQIDVSKQVPFAIASSWKTVKIEFIYAYTHFLIKTFILYKDLFFVTRESIQMSRILF